MTRFFVKRAAYTALVLSAMGLAGCGSLVPKADAPQATLRDSFRTDTVATDVPLSSTAQASEWDGFFADERLRGVVGLALTGNRSLRASVAAVDRARALYGISEAARWPELEGSATATRQRNVGNTVGGASGNTVGSYTVSLGLAAWEVDLFNRLGSLEGAALARFLAQQQTQQGARLSLVA